MPVVSWLTSSFSEEEENLDKYLKRFALHEVESAVSYWSTEIEAGRHNPMAFDGAYEAA
jgi:hypothetical protein